MLFNLTKQEVGRLGEFYTKQFLELHGFQILEENWRFQQFELDLICEMNGTLHIVEVRTLFRGAKQRHSCLNYHKQQSIFMASKWYNRLTQRKYGKIQFDLAKVSGNMNVVKIQYLDNVFFPGLENALK